MSPVRRLALAASLLLACGVSGKAADLVAQGPSRVLRERPKGAPASSPGHPALLVVALDGVDRTTLYELIRGGKMPELAKLLGPEPQLDERLLSTLPSSTMAAWTTEMTGVPPAVHGVTGNEWFARESTSLAAPAPVSFHDAEPTLAIYTDGYLDALKGAPSVYERMRQRDPDVLVWVGMHPIFSGADRLLVTKRTVFAQAFEHAVEKVTRKIDGHDEARTAYEALDIQLAENVDEALEKGPVPDVLTVYFAGIDLYAHVAESGPDDARRTYLTEVTEKAIARLRLRLEQRHALDDRYVVVIADHGHTGVMHDEAHALAMAGPDDPPALMKKAGYRVRPFKITVPGNDVFDAVYVPGGAFAYLYVADRSACPKVCDWSRPARFAEDVLPLAEAFFRADRDGALVPELRGTLDMILTRRPKAAAEIDAPFEVYVGDGKTVPLDAYLAAHPHPTYVDMAARLRDLAVGPKGDRAGDILLVAHNGDRDRPEERFYFADLYRSWHGSPSRRDSEIPLAVGHHHRSRTDIAKVLDRHLRSAPYAQKVTDILLDLRYGE